MTVWIILIMISPILYHVTYVVTLWLAAKLGKRPDDIVIRHFHNGKLVSETTIHQTEPNHSGSTNYPQP